MTKKILPKHFHTENLKKLRSHCRYPRMDGAVVEENSFKSMQAIIDHCAQVGSYFKSVTTNFKTLDHHNNAYLDFRF